MRAKVLPDKGQRKRPWRHFSPGRWYPAELDPAAPGIVRLHNGNLSADWPAEAVEIRQAPDDEWLLRSISRQAGVLDGQAIEYPARLAECPEGHTRSVPTRFQERTVNLRCADCGRHYRLIMPA